MHITLEQPDERLSVYVQDGCGPVTGDDFVACGNSAFAGRENQVDATLSNGQVVTVIVAGFDSEGGAYTLSSSFEP